jgi:hypothetical protein
MKRSIHTTAAALAGLLALTLLTPGSALAHCDGIDGPVVKAARQALATGNVNLVLAWVQSKDEAEIRTAFSHTQAVRSLNQQARQLADQYFFETLVRVHRAGEGEPFTGLQPAGRDLGPAIPAADQAVETGSVDALVKTLSDAAGHGLKDRFQQVAARRQFAKDDVAAAREYVKTYVEFLHYVDKLHEAVHGNGHQEAHNSQSTGHPAANH